MENKNENTKLDLLKKLLRGIEQAAGSAIRLLDAGDEQEAEAVKKILEEAVISGEAIDVGGGRVVEGIFDGTHMVGSDGKQYAIPPNYASKSKLVEGDMLKLTIGSEGKFLYKQIGPIERDRIIGKLEQDAVTKQYSVVADSKKWQVLTASITYFKGEEGDEAIILVPKNAPSKWAAVENVVKKI